jgi:hypothetical protein
VKQIGEDGKFLTHDPMCEIFPTEVSTVLYTVAEEGK